MFSSRCRTTWNCVRLMAKISSRSQALLSLRKPLDVDRIMADQLADLLGELGGVSEDIFVGIWRQEAADGDPVDPSGRIAWRNADEIDRFPSRARWSQMAGSVIERDVAMPRPL